MNALLARLDDALSAQRRFTADAAHELRTPLAALKLQVGLAERATDDAARAHALAELNAGVDRAAHLVDQLVTMARLEPEAPARNEEPVDLAALARKRSSLARRSPPKSRSTSASPAPPDVAVRGDAASLAMLIANLLDNALRYTPTGGQASTSRSTGTKGRARCLSYGPGPGIPAAERERVFERFYRMPGSGPAQSRRQRPWPVDRAPDRRGARGQH